MTTDEVRAIARRHIDHMNTHDATLMAADHTEQGVVESPSTGTHHGRQEIAQSYQMWVDAFPDLELVLEELIAEGTRAVLVLRLAGTHRGTFLGLSATEKRIEFRAVFLQTLDADQIAHERRVYDFSGVLIKLGVLKVKPA